MDDGELVALLCSRLCHDLVGPVGAIANGVEMLEMEDDPALKQEAVGLLAMSARQAIGRLRFYRLAFGASGGDDAPLPMAEAAAVAAELLQGGRVALDWPPGAVPELRKPAVRLLLNLVLLGAEGLGRGGDLSVRGAPDPAGGVRVSVAGSGATVGLSGAVRSLLESGRADELEPKASPALLVRRLADGLGVDIAVAQAPGRVELTATLPAQPYP